MVNREGTIKASAWIIDKDFKALTRSAQAMFAQLLSQKNLDWSGMQPLMVSTWAKGCDELTEDQVWVDLGLLQARRFIFFDRDTDELFVRSYMRVKGVVKVPNILKSALRSASLVSSPTIKVEMACELRRLRRAAANQVADELDPKPCIAEPSANPKPIYGEGLNPKPYISEGSSNSNSNSYPLDTDLPVVDNSSSEIREDVEQLCITLRDLIVENGSPATITEGWRTQARLLLDKDGRELGKAVNLVRWCQQDPFWRSNILSMPTFRRKYDQLRLRALAEHENGKTGGRTARETRFAAAEAMKTNPDARVLRHFSGGEQKAIEP